MFKDQYNFILSPTFKFLTEILLTISPFWSLFSSSHEKNSLLKLGVEVDTLALT